MKITLVKKHLSIQLTGFIFTLIILSCVQKKESKSNLENPKNTTEYFKLTFPDTILENSMFGKLEYFYELPDSVVTDKEDYSIMTVYAQLTKDERNPIRIKTKETDSFFAERKNFKDTLVSPIFFETKGLKGDYFLSGKAIIKSLPANNGRKDTLSDLTMYIREFDFVLPEPIKINE